MTTRPEVLERRQGARRAEIADRLLPVVESLLVDTPSYWDLSVDQIIGGTGLSRSTFYRHFEDKSDLLIAFSEVALADVLEAATRPWELPPAAGRADFEAAMRRNIDVYRPHIDLIKAMAEASDPAVRERFEEGFAVVQRAVAAHIRAGQEAGTVRPELQPDETAGWITWMAERGMTQLIRRAGDDAELERLCEALTAIAWHAVYR